MSKKLFLMMLSGTISVNVLANPAFLSPIDEPLEDTRLRFVIKFGGEQAEYLKKSTFDAEIQKHIQAMFGAKKTLTEQEFLTNHQTQHQKAIETYRQVQIKQTKIRFDSIDKNADGQINLHEFQTVGLASFQRYDTNQDGYISSEDDQNKIEADAQAKHGHQLIPRIKPLFSMPTTHNASGFLALYGKDGQTKLSLADYLKAREEQYQRTDSNADGVLSHAEYEAEFLQRVNEMLEKRLNAQHALTQKRFKMIDTNADGKVSRADVVKFSQQYFAFWDTNGDGIVTLTEKLPNP